MPLSFSLHDHQTSLATNCNSILGLGLPQSALRLKMSEFSQGIPSTKTPSTPVKMPRYRVTRRADQSLAFDPPAGSRELANALSIKYPLCENLEQQLQSALLDFINKEEDESSEYTFTPPKNRQQSLSPNTSFVPVESPPSSRSSGPTLPRNGFQSSISVWSITTGKPVEKKRNRIKYDTEKRVKVAGVRKSGACDFHRKKKTEVRTFQKPCDPLLTTKVHLQSIPYFAEKSCAASSINDTKHHPQRH